MAANPGLSQAFAVRTATVSWLVTLGTAPDGAGDSPEVTAKLLKLASFAMLP